MRFASLGSGSRGNATLVESDGRCLMIDCGFSIKETERRLERLGKSADQIDAILLTHEHGDHVAGASRFSRKYSIPVWASHGTTAGLKEPSIEIHCFDSHSRFELNGFEIDPVVVPHDAKEPVQFVFGNGSRRLGVLTDVGSITPFILESLSGCDALLLECNHDEQMLLQGRYPQALKKRVGGSLGHLSNRQAADFLTRIDCGSLQHLVAAHLSEQNNSLELAVSAVAEALNCEQEWIGVARQEEGLTWRSIQ